MIESSIIIPHFNNTAKLSSCLGALHEFYGNRKDLEIIVVDNGSTEDLSSIQTQYPQVRWLVETSMQSPYPCRNTGVRAARGTVVVLLDSNCIPSTNFLEIGLLMLTQGYDIVGGKLEVCHSGSWTSRFDTIYTTLLATATVRTALPGAVLFARRSAFSQAGYFLSHVRSLGDIEWSQRAYNKGLRLAITNVHVARYQAKEWPSWVRKTIRLGTGSKEKYLHTGGRLTDWHWWWRVFKTCLPPNPSMVKDMTKRNEILGTKLSGPLVFWYCMLTKWLRAWGMLWGRVEKPRDVNLQATV